MSWQTRKNWLIDTIVFAGALIASISGVYYLYFPSDKNTLVIFTHSTWDELHTWGGLLMIAVVVVHFVLHWDWVVRMTRRMVGALRTGEVKLSKGARINLAINVVLGVSFLLCALTGLYFYFLTSGGYEGGRNPNWDPGILFSRPIWDFIHTWSGVVMIVVAVLHFYIHWRWIKNVTKKFFRSLFS